MEIAVIGNNDFVTGFQLAGVKQVYEVKQSIDERISEALENKRIGVLLMEDEFLQRASTRTKKLLGKLVTPVVITLSLEGRGADLRNLIKRTVGVDLWK